MWSLMWYIQDKIHLGKVVKYWNLRIMRLRIRTTIFLKFSYLQEMQYIILRNIFLNPSLACILLELSIFSTDAMNKCDNFPQSRIPAESRPSWRPKWALSPISYTEPAIFRARIESSGSNRLPFHICHVLMSVCAKFQNVITIWTICLKLTS